MNAQAGAMDKMLAAYGEHGKIAIADKKADCVREVAAAWKKAEMKIGRAGLIEAEARDLRSRDEIVAHLAKALARADEPRNAIVCKLDLAFLVFFVMT